MSFFSSTFSELSAWKILKGNLERGEYPLSVTGLSPVHRAQFLCTIASHSSAPWLVVTSTAKDAIRLVNDIQGMGGDAMHFPQRDLLFTPAISRSLEYEQERIAVLKRLCDGSLPFVVASIEALLQPTIPRDVLERACLKFSVGDILDLSRLSAQLLANGFARCERVEGKGQFAIRGDILDIYPVQNETAVRVELWGDQIDSISSLDVDSQRRQEPLTILELTPSMELLCNPEELRQKIEDFAKGLRSKKANMIREYLERDCESLASGIPLLHMDKYYSLLYERALLTDYVEGNVILCEYSDVVRMGTQEGSRLKAELAMLFEEGILCRGLDGSIAEPSELHKILMGGNTIFLSQFPHTLDGIELRGLVSFDRCLQNATWGGSMSQLLEDLEEYIRGGYRTVIAVGSEKVLPVWQGDLEQNGIHARIGDVDCTCERGEVVLIARSISAGFAYQENRTALVSHVKMHAKRKQRIHASHGVALQSLNDLQPGDLVVHITHGIGKFIGIQTQEMEGIAKDYIVIQYFGTEKLFVPVTQLDMVSRYMGTQDEGAVKLSRLSSPQWSKTCTRVRQGVRDMAKELSQLYAKREKSQGIAFDPDDTLQHEFEEHFVYEETHDQLQSIREIKSDMQAARPMERLLCGDVGFGKTEVAFRAAMKCVLSGRQCAILAPTTLLALQHYRTACTRFESVPVKIEMLSSLRSTKQAKIIKEQVAKGKIDILIGTHSILQKDVRFQSLGLAIIDEEQRFGVKDKEHFKSLFAGIDMLSLSATPIPRTLNMALAGIRDMSVLSEPPQDRHAVQTYVMEHNDGVIYQAIARELSRGGQVYYIHNVIETIYTRASKLQELFPEAKLAVAHGRLSEQEITDVWQRVVDGEVDILVCTTIIETGVDIPNANTLLIERSDCFGLGQLYQLRGRVGRSTRKAFAYFFFDKGKMLSDEANRRLQAMREFTQFGSGFQIAMRDLEIRGAGSILGGSQHGHMETVGYDLYMQMLAEELAIAKGEPLPRVHHCMVDIQIDAFIPEGYIASSSERMDMYRKIARIKDEDDRLEIIDELLDRYGEPPQSALGLVTVAQIKNNAAQLGITEIRQIGKQLRFFTETPTETQIQALAIGYEGRIVFHCSQKSYIGIMIQANQNSLELMREVIAMMARVIDSQ